MSTSTNSAPTNTAMSATNGLVQFTHRLQILAPNEDDYDDDSETYEDMLDRENDMDYVWVDADYHTPSDEAYSVSSGTMTPNGYTDSEDDFVTVEEEDVTEDSASDDVVANQEDTASDSVSKQEGVDADMDDLRVIPTSPFPHNVEALTYRSPVATRNSSPTAPSSSTAPSIA
jgi:hypothetical protein